MPRGAGRRVDLPRAPDEFFEFVVGPPEEYSDPVRPIGGHVLEEIPKKKVAFAATSGTAVEEFRTPIGRDCLGLRPRLWCPARCLARSLGGASPSTHRDSPAEGDQ